MIFGAGCNRMEVTSPYSCAVMVEDTPVNECRLVLLQNLGDEWKPVWEGVSDGKGVVALQPVQGAPVPQGQVELAPLVESIGSGDWQLASPWADPKKTPIKVPWPPAHSHFEIKFPRKAVRAI